MTYALLISVRFHDGRYHGSGSWPPEPARLFQALVAGAVSNGKIPVEALAALAWLERLDPPDIATPPARNGQSFKNFVPNNDLDAVGGDPNAAIRAAKEIRPRLFDSGVPLLYLWRYDEEEDKAKQIEMVADQLYQLGRGVDMAWATAELLDEDKAAKRLADHGGAIYRRVPGNGTLFACPMPGSLASLIDRYEKSATRFKMETKVAPKKKAPLKRKLEGLTFSQPPKPRFEKISYNSPPERRLFNIWDLAVKAGFHAWPLSEVVPLVEMIRDRSAAKLSKAYEEAGRSDRSACVERVFVGRESTEADKLTRIRIIPLPSIGFQHTDPSIRRILLEIPPDCPLPHADIIWAFAGLGIVEKINAETGEIVQDVRLIEAEDQRMLGHYGADSKGPAHHWWSITPVALPTSFSRRRIDSTGAREDAKGVSEGFPVEPLALGAVRAALRHAGITNDILSIRVQREPWTSKGEHAERFAIGPRFTRHCLWHVALTLAEPLAGPLVLGDGRFFGLGLMAPVPDRKPAAKADAVLYTLSPEVRPPVGQGAAVTQSIRAALMSLARTPDGGVLPLFSGHLDGSGPARPGDHRHVYLAVLDTDGDGLLDQVQVIAPWRVDRSVEAKDGERRDFARITSDLRIVRAGAAGVLTLSAAQALPVERGTEWVSLTPYRPTRHPAADDDVARFIADDVRRELSRRQFPQPTAVTVISVTPGPKGGLSARLSLTFATPVEGPILLGRDAHRGGGMFGVREQYQSV
jgi:CRISPR-associated protein Csb2